MDRRIAVWCILGILAAAAPAAADIVVLEGGRKIEGRVVEDGEDVIIEMAFGSITVKRSRVVRIDRKRSTVDEYNTRAEALGEKPAAADVFRLGEWCARKGLLRRAKDAYKRALEIDPDHDGARKVLGFVRHDGRWMTQDEKMIATGHVRYQGRWVTAAERVRLEREAAEREESRREQVERETERARRLAETDKLQAEREKLYAERALLDAERRRLLLGGNTLEALRWRARFGWPVAPYLLIHQHHHHGPAEPEPKADGKPAPSQPRANTPPPAPRPVRSKPKPVVTPKSKSAPPPARLDIRVYPSRDDKDDADQ